MVLNKWACCIITLNGGEYIWYAIKSIYDFMKESGGKIIVIEGSTKYATDINKDGNSTDNTEEIALGFIRDSKPDFITYKKLGKVEDKKVLRNAYLEEIRKISENERPEWVLVLDDDELYKMEDLRRLDKFITENPKIQYIFNSQRWFWRDFKTEAFSCEDESFKQIKQGNRKDKLFFDCVGNRLRQGQYHERIFRFNSEYKYINSHSTITDSEGRDVYIDPFYEDKRIVFSGCPRYHYGYMTTTNKMYHRYQYYERRDKERTPEHIDEIWRDNYGHFLLRNIPKNTSTKIRPYFGTHPIIIQQHPYWKIGKCPMAEDSKKIIEDCSFSWAYETYEKNGKMKILYRHEFVLAKLSSNSKILDVGGWGRFASRLVQEGHSVTLLNKNTYDIRFKDSKVTYRYGDICNPPLDKKVLFDYINCSETLEHIENKELALEQMYGLLKEGGVLFGTVPMPGKYDHFTNAPNSKFSHDRLKQLLTDAKFKHIKVLDMPSMKKENETTVFWFWGEKNGI